MITKLLKYTILPIAVNLGLEKLLRLTGKGHIVNLFYHGVVEKDSTHIFQRHLNAPEFEKQIKYLSRNFDIIPLEEAFDIFQKKKKVNHKLVTISFDDGYQNNLTQAIPILEAYNAFTTFFISGICAENKPILLWSDVVAICRFISENDFVEIEGIPYKKSGRYNLINSENNLSAFHYLKHLSVERRDKIIAEMYSKYNLSENLVKIPQEIYRLMSAEEIATLSRSRIAAIGSHCYSHFNLANIAYNDAKVELEKSKSVLEAIIKREVDSVAFPDGNYNDEIKALAMAAGYKKLLAVDYQCASDLHDINILNRFGIPSTTTFEVVAAVINNSFRKYAYA